MWYSGQFTSGISVRQPIKKTVKPEYKTPHDLSGHGEFFSLHFILQNREISYSVRPSYALGWRQVQRTCTDLILRIAEIVNLVFSQLFQVQYDFKLFPCTKWWEIRICGSKENFPEGAGASHLPRSSGVRWARPAGQKPPSKAERWLLSFTITDGERVRAGQEANWWLPVWQRKPEQSKKFFSNCSSMQNVWQRRNRLQLEKERAGSVCLSLKAKSMLRRHRWRCSKHASIWAVHGTIVQCRTVWFRQTEYWQEDRKGEYDLYPCWFSC